MGRACRYGDAETNELPIVLIGAKGLKCIELPTRATRNSKSMAAPRNPLHNLLPHSKVAWTKGGRPTMNGVPSDPEEQSKYYREHTRPKDKPDRGKPGAGHVDCAGLKNSTDWRNNSRRFMLVGLPQIGKTGSCYHSLALETKIYCSECLRGWSANGNRGSSRLRFMRDCLQVPTCGL